MGHSAAMSPRVNRARNDPTNQKILKNDEKTFNSKGLVHEIEDFRKMSGMALIRLFITFAE